MLRVGVFTPSQPDDHVEHLSAFAEGCSLDPETSVQLYDIDKGYVDCDIAVVFGVGKKRVPASWKRGHIVFEHHQWKKKPIVIIERGFIQREKYYGAAWNGLNGLADFCNTDSPSDRWDRLGITLRPYRDPNPSDYVLVCGQVPWDASVQHTDHPAWCREIIGEIRKHTEREVRFRPHPLAKDFDYGVEASKNSWEVDISGAHAVVAYNSTSSALSIIEGLPIFAFDPGSMAYEVANHNIADIENPLRPDRTAWAYNLAYCQWTAEEMNQGLTWEHLKRGQPFLNIKESK